MTFFRRAFLSASGSAFCTAVVLSVVLCSAGTACAGKKVSIGLIAPMAGEFYRDGVYCVDAARFAVKEVNRAGGLKLGGQVCSVDLIIRDSRNMPAEARKAAVELVDKLKVSALVGPLYSGNAREVEPVCEKAGVPMVLPFATVNDLTEGKTYVFRVPYTNSFQGRALASFVWDNLHKTTAAVLFGKGTVYGGQLAGTFEKHFAELGGKVVLSRSYPPNTRDFSREMKNIAASGAQVLFLPTRSKLAMIQVRQARRAGFKGVLIGGDSWDGTEIRRVKEAEGAYFCDHWAPDIPHPQSRAFAENYEKDRRHVPVELEALTYDAFGVLFRALRTAGSAEPKRIAEALRTMPPHEGVTGIMDYSRSGDPDTYMIISRIKDGRVRFADMVEP